MLPSKNKVIIIIIIIIISCINVNCIKCECKFCTLQARGMAAGYRPLPTQLSVSGDDTEERAIQEVYRYESQTKIPSWFLQMAIYLPGHSFRIQLLHWT